MFNIDLLETYTERQRAEAERLRAVALEAGNATLVELHRARENAYTDVLTQIRQQCPAEPSLPAPQLPAPIDRALAVLSPFLDVPDARAAPDWAIDIARLLTSKELDRDAAHAFQARVAPWMAATFEPDVAGDIQERGDRLLEEVLELLQAHGYDPSRVATLRDYVYGRPVGEPDQEVGGVMVTLAAFCLAAGLDMHAAGERELRRIWGCIGRIRAKQAAKRHLHAGSPLPGHVITGDTASLTTAEPRE